MSGVVIGVTAFLVMAGIAVLAAIISAVSAVAGHSRATENDED